jgi:KipI family sensor histidine kinase inhibitor
MDGCVFLPVGDCALTVEFTNEISEETNGKVRALSQALKEAKLPGVTEWVPTYRSVLVCYDPGAISFRRLTGKLRRLASHLGQAAKASKRVWEIPVCYGGTYGEDLGFVASNAGLSPEEVVAIHSGVDYRIYMLGFLPGFPYLGGLNKRIHTPRLKTPRTRILPGSVGIGGEQTGIYPMPSPGGWQLIGMTPVKLYDPLREQPILYEAGDFLRFVPIDEARFEQIRNQVMSGTFELKVIEEGDS